MKKQFASMVLVCAMVLFGAGTGLPFDYTGTVTSCTPGGGLTLDIGDEEVLLFGIGPVSYWDRMEVDHPSIGEELTATGYTVVSNGIERNIVSLITIDGKSIALRDQETGKPLWRGTNGVSTGPGASGGNGNPSSGGNAGSGASVGPGGSASSGGSKGGACK